MDQQQQQQQQPLTTLQVSAELERIEQAITLTLQQIDGNFAACHEAACSLLPLTANYMDTSKQMWQGVQSWAQFFEYVGSSKSKVQPPFGKNGEASENVPPSTRRRRSTRSAAVETPRRDSTVNESTKVKTTTTTARSRSRSRKRQPLSDLRNRPGDRTSEAESSPPIPQLHTLTIGDHHQRKIEKRPQREQREQRVPSPRSETPARSRRDTKPGQSPSLLRQFLKSRVETAAARDDVRSSSETTTASTRNVGLSTTQAASRHETPVRSMRMFDAMESPESPNFSPPVTMSFGTAAPAGPASSFLKPMTTTTMTTTPPPLAPSARKFSTAQTPMASARKRVEDILAYVAESPLPPLPMSSFESANQGSVIPTFRSSKRHAAVKAVQEDQELEDDIDEILNAVTSPSALDVALQIAEAEQEQHERELEIDSESEMGTSMLRGGRSGLSESPTPAVRSMSATATIAAAPIIPMNRYPSDSPFSSPLPPAPEMTCHLADRFDDSPGQSPTPPTPTRSYGAEDENGDEEEGDEHVDDLGRLFDGAGLDETLDRIDGDESDDDDDDRVRHIGTEALHSNNQDPFSVDERPSGRHGRFAAPASTTSSSPDLPIPRFSIRTNPYERQLADRAHLEAASKTASKGPIGLGPASGYDLGDVTIGLAPRRR